MGRLNRKLKGSTLVETIVSMMLIVLIMAIVMQSMVQVNKAVGTDLKTDISFLIKNNLMDPPATEGYSEITDDFSSLKVSRNLTRYKNYEDLYIFEIKILNTKNQTVASARKIISSYEIENKLTGNE